MDTAQSGEQRCCIISRIGTHVVLVSKRRGNRGHDASHLLFHQHRIGRSLPHEPTPSLCLYAREHISSGEWRRRMYLYTSESSPLSSRKDFTLNLLVKHIVFNARVHRYLCALTSCTMSPPSSPEAKLAFYEACNSYNLILDVH